MRKRLAIITTHPIQYNAPWFKLLATTDLIVKVFYTNGEPADKGNFDAGFGRVVKWDIPLLEGYEYTFVKNVAENPGTYHFKGVINPTLNEEVAAWKPNAVLVIGWSFQSHINCLRFFKKNKIPVLFRGDSTLLDEKGGLKREIRRIFLKWVYRHIDFGLYAGTHNKAYFRAHGLREHQLVFAPHAIDNNRFADTDQSVINRVETWRAELGYTPEDIVILFAGKLEPKKEPGILLELAKKSTQPRIKFLFVGNGVMENELKEQAAGHANIQFIDFQNQTMMPMVYRLGDLFILPSRGPGETWGLALNEAMACSKPVIASDKVGGAIDLIRPGVNGHIFQAGNVADLQQKLMTMIEPNRLQAMGQQSLQIIREWNFGQIIHAIQSVLRN